MCKIFSIILFFIIMLPKSGFAFECPNVKVSSENRLIVVVSDLHFGLGHSPNGEWVKTEDFRWHNALKGFLERVKKCGGNSVDLVIAGDALELWQPPKSVSCEGVSPDLGCTSDDYNKIVDIIVDQHRNDFVLFGDFADSGNNRVFFIPGNHDAPLLLTSIWNKIFDAVSSKSARVFRCGTSAKSPCGLNGWLSEAGHVYIEHGHQIGSDVNKFSNWPIITKLEIGTEYIERPWGQLFVQKLFNEQEFDYPIIDNLMPESAGIRYRMADRGLWKSSTDVARFLSFNILETSFNQKSSTLGSSNNSQKTWDIDSARKMGYKLFLNTLPSDDLFRKSIELQDDKSAEVRLQLNKILMEMPEDDVAALCTALAVTTKDQSCNKSSLNAIGQSILFSKKYILRNHLKYRIANDAPKMKVFIYAHTHSLEAGWDVDIKGHSPVTIFNTGAFQRLISEKNSCC